jgi:lysophospholipase L1-like esterase
MLLTACKSPAEQRICFFGSSVCRGVGAEALNGYAAQVTETLPAGWESVNISIDGNNTYDLFARFDRDMTPVEAQYVVIGISLGNEGLHEKGARAVLSYRENMPRLIRMLQEQGRTVIVTNNYPRADFNQVDYADLCEVNLEVQQWNVPTINLFGTIDDGVGRWAAHLWNGSDIYHPNQLGHVAMASAFPLTMWEALQAGKPLPEYICTQGDQNGVESVSFVPEGHVQSYTLSYTSADTIYTEVYSAAQRKLWVYANGQLTSTSEELDKTVDTITIQGNNIHQLLFYRAAMTSLEVSALSQGKMLRSSLEIYCPLLGGDPTNYAQTMNCVTIHNK